MNIRAQLMKTVKESVADETFVKFVLSKPANNTDLTKVTAWLVQIKSEDMISVVTSFKTNDVTKNYPVAKGVDILQKLVETSFENATLFTTENNYQLDRSPSGQDKLHKSAPTSKSVQNKEHDHEKKRLVGKDRPFLTTLGLTNSDGEIKAKMTGKYKQVESFINILSSAINGSTLKESKSISVYDMGSGSAYVSFAIYDHVVNTMNKGINLVGVDTNEKLTARNNLHAKDLGFSGISFVASPIAEMDNFESDIVVALHACNTATDDALFSGIRSGAQIIILSPCCHQELRTKMKNPEVLKPMLKFGTYKEIEAVMLTDTIRTLVLEVNGYKTNLFEFVSDEHTGKNNIIVAVKKQSNQNKDMFVNQLDELKKFFNIQDDLYLESLIDN